MDAPCEIIHTISEFIGWAERCYDTLKCNNKSLFFRGHADCNWDLEPSVLRGLRPDERRLIIDYKQVLAPEPAYVDNIERILVEMQHHGIPTRMLDWSINPLVSLFFACSDLQSKWASVACLNPWNCYQRNPDPGCPAYHFEILKEARFLLALRWSFEDIRDYCAKKYNYTLKSPELDLPLPIVGRHIDPRVSAQQGCFVLWGKMLQPLDSFRRYRENITYCKTPKKAKPHLLRSLARLGISHFTVMHDYEGFAKDVKTKRSIYDVM